jgi:cyclopropane-fatty-acyl-phospholipid synthase
MKRPETVAAHLAGVLRVLLGSEELPWRLRGWDGSTAGPTGAPVLTVRSPAAVRRLIWAPGELGLARAYVAGDIEIEGDVFATLDALSPVSRQASSAAFVRPTARDWVTLARTAVALDALGTPPAPPPEEFPRRRRGRLHSPRRDARVVAHHYDVGNEFYALVLGPTLVYSCAVWADDRTGLDAAQEAKLDLVCRKLGLVPGMRLLDVGCGWGSLALHAARRYGVDVVGVTLSTAQAGLAQQRATEAGLSGQVTIRVQDYREVDDGPFDAVSSIGMAEHVGSAAMPGYVAALHGLLRPGGRLLHHTIGWAAGESTWNDGTFIARYVFPDGELLPLSQTIAALQAGGFEILDVEALRQHYALTLRAWVDRLEKHWDATVALSSEGRARVWRLYMAAAALSFETGKLGVDQVLVRRPGGKPPPLRLRHWI